MAHLSLVATEKDKDTSESNESGSSDDSAQELSSQPSGETEGTSSFDASSSSGQTTEDITVDQPIKDLSAVGESADPSTDRERPQEASNITEILEVTAADTTSASDETQSLVANPFTDDTTEIITEKDSPLPSAPEPSSDAPTDRTVRVDNTVNEIPSPTSPSADPSNPVLADEKTTLKEVTTSPTPTPVTNASQTPATPASEPKPQTPSEPSKTETISDAKTAEVQPTAQVPTNPPTGQPLEPTPASTDPASTPTAKISTPSTEPTPTPTAKPSTEPTSTPTSTDPASTPTAKISKPSTEPTPTPTAKPSTDPTPTSAETVEIAADKAAAETTSFVNQKSGASATTPSTPAQPAQAAPVPNVLSTPTKTSPEPTQKLVTPTPKPTSQPPTPETAPLGSSFKAKKGGKGKVLALLLIPVLLVGGFFAAWAIDQNSRGERVARNTELNGVDISGLSGDELSAAITKATDDVLDVDLTVNANGDSVVTTPRALGAEPDIEATTADALESRRSGFILARPFSWASSFLRTDQVSATYLVDQKAADEASRTIFEPIIEPVIETSIEADGSGFRVVPGEIGERIEASEIENELPDALGESDQPLLELTPVEGAPQISEADANTAADEASDALDEPLEIQLLDNTATAEPDELRKMVTLDNSGSDLTWQIDNDLAVEELKKKFTNVGTDGDEATFTIVNDMPVVVPVSSAVECCGEDTGQRIKEAALNRPAEGELVIVEPEFVDEDPTADKLNSYGIIEEVSSFTTPHAPGGPRVTNIQRFADLMRGTVIEVDEELSLNESVGKRTIEKGFVADGAINQGVIEQQVGGGISQFATTFFNASFFAGIEIQEHQFHTLAIASRYPLGRESTIDYPSVDVRVKNTSEHPILIWTSYTSDSITVTFYSQKHLTVRDVNGNELAFDVYERGRDSTFPPEITSDRECRVYTTRRFTEFPDGEIVEDSFSGFYRPGEGRDCNGDLTPKAQAELDAKNAANNDG